MIQIQEMKFLRQGKSCTRIDRIRNEDIKNEENLFDLNKRIKKTKKNGNNTSREWKRTAYQ